MMSQVSNALSRTSAGSAGSRAVPVAALRPALWLAVLGSLALAVLAVLQSDSISQRIERIEAPYVGADQAADSGSFLVTAVLIVAALNLIGWVATVTVFRRKLAAARVWAVVGLVVGLSLAAALLNVEEYGERVYGMQYGLLALVPCAAGVWGLVVLFRRPARAT